MFSHWMDVIPIETSCIRGWWIFLGVQVGKRSPIAPPERALGQLIAVSSNIRTQQPWTIAYQSGNANGP